MVCFRRHVSLSRRHHFFFIFVQCIFFFLRFGHFYLTWSNFLQWKHTIGESFFFCFFRFFRFVFCCFSSNLTGLLKPNFFFQFFLFGFSFLPDLFADWLNWVKKLMILFFFFIFVLFFRCAVNDNKFFLIENKFW